MSDSTPGEIYRGATIDPSGRYRYLLAREWEPGVESLGVVMLNPSTADASIDDPTIRRCIAFAKRDGWGGIHVLNLYALRATDPRELDTADDPVGPENDDYLRRLAGARGRTYDFPTRTVLVAWGARARFDRITAFLELVGNARLLCLGTTKDGQPRHPLYVRGDTPLVEWDRKFIA